LREAGCDTDHYPAFEEDRERLSVSKLVTQKLDMDRFNLKKLSKMEVTEHYQLNI